jgi:hypothetical protein
MKVANRELRAKDGLILFAVVLGIGGEFVRRFLQDENMGGFLTAIGISLIGLQSMFEKDDSQQVKKEIEYWLKHLSTMLKGRDRDDEIQITEKLDSLISENNYLLPKGFDEKWLKLRVKIYQPEGITIRDEMLEMLKK